MTYLTMKSSSQLLCCCEYESDEGLQHLIACCCNCEALDAVCDRCLRCQPVDAPLLTRLRATLLDRIRVPWPGGAVRVPPSALLAVVVVPLLVNMAALSLTSCLVAYTVLLPTLLYTAYRHLRHPSLPPPLTAASARLQQPPFYPAFLASTVCWLYYYVSVYVIGQLKVSSLEALLLVALSGAALACLYLTHATACHGYAAPVGGEVDVLGGGGGWRMCGDCGLQVPILATHCGQCGGCYLLRDHHCLWLGCCISATNSRWFLLSLCCGSPALGYASLLFLTAGCVPGYLSPLLPLLPVDCRQAYGNWTSSLCLSCGAYCLLLGVMAAALLWRQVARAARGTKRRGAKSGFAAALRNCATFWAGWTGNSAPHHKSVLN